MNAETFLQFLDKVKLIVVGDPFVLFLWFYRYIIENFASKFIREIAR